MSKFPPAQEDLLQAFQKYLNTSSGSSYEAVKRPDQEERHQQQVDYILRNKVGRELAVEFTSIWRSQSAGQEDAYWDGWTRQCQQYMRCKVPGQFRVYVPLRVPQGLDPLRFADELVTFIASHNTELAALAQNSSFLRTCVCGTEIFVAHADAQGSNIEFARQISRSELDRFPAVIEQILHDRGPKLRPHREEKNRETWLVIYNTIWPLMSPLDTQRQIGKLLGPQYFYIDHVGIIAGNPPDDAWVILVR